MRGSWAEEWPRGREGAVGGEGEGYWAGQRSGREGGREQWGRSGEEWGGAEVRALVVEAVANLVATQARVVVATVVATQAQRWQ